MLAGTHYAEHQVPLFSFILVATTPLIALIALLPERWCYSAKLQYSLMVLLWLVYLAMAVGLAVEVEKLAL